MSSLSPEQYVASLAQKRGSSAALVRDDEGKVLILKPTYRTDGWLIPGGAMEKDESPLAACIREVREEIGLTLPIGRLLCVSYGAARGVKTEAIHFIFDGGVVDAETIDSIRLQTSEAAEMRFLPHHEALTLLVPTLRDRVARALDARDSEGCSYVEQ